MKTTQKKKNLLVTCLTFLALAIISLVSCNSDACAYDTNVARACAFTPENTPHTTWTVATCYAKNPGDFVAVIYNTSLNSAAIPGTDWGASGISIIHAPTWTAANMGQVFGIAIDKDERVYFASSHIYAQGVSPTPPQNTIPAQVYKCTSPIWTPIPLFTLPNTGIGNLNGIGNITYDKVNDQLFASNLEDGKIYRYSTTGTYLGVFDPWSADTGTPGIVALDEQVWGIGVNYEFGNVKVYFPRITTSGAREMYSVTLDNVGAFPSGINPEVLEFSGIAGDQLCISDIAFSSNGREMLLSERGLPHFAKVLSYTKTSSWTFNRQYYVGGKVSAPNGRDGENAAGGVDFAYGERGGVIDANCDEFFWASGNYMDATSVSGKIYGIEGIKYTGNNSTTAISPTANKDTDLFIDFNGTYLITDKNTIGDVEVIDANTCFDICP